MPTPLKIEIDLDKQAAINACRRSLAKENYLQFLLYIQNRRGIDYQVGPHTKHIAEEIDRALDDLFLRNQSSYIRVSVPFRHGKSDLISRFLVPYVIGKYGSPSLKNKNNPFNQPLETILGTYSADLSTALSREARQVVNSEEYREVFPEISLSKESSSKVDWETVATEDLDNPTSGAPVSKFRACGMLGGATGRGASMLILDDYLKNRKDAESQTLRDTQWDSFKDNFMTRLAPAHIVFILATRWHLDDVIGRIEERNDPLSEKHDPEFPLFKEIVYKAKQDDGTYLFPERFKAKWYETMFATLGPYSAAALLQSEPIAKGGNMLPSDKIQYIDAVPPSILTKALPTRFWDLASSEKELATDDPDATAGTRGFVWFDKAGLHESDDVLLSKAYFFVTDVTTLEALAPKRNEVIVETAHADGPLVYQGVEAQGGYKDSAGILKALLKGKSVVHAVTVHRAKFVRIEEYLHPIMDAGRVIFVRGWWNAKASIEISQFPGGKHDDIPDSMASCFKMAFERAKVALRSGYLGAAGLSSGRGLVQVRKQAEELDNDGLSDSISSTDLSSLLTTHEEIYDEIEDTTTVG